MLRMSGDLPLKQWEMSSTHMLSVVNVFRSTTQDVFLSKKIVMRLVSFLKRAVPLYTRKFQNYIDVFLDSYE